MRIIAVAIALLLGLQMQLQAAASFRAVGAAEAELGDYYELEFILTGDSKSSGTPQFPQFEGFKVVNGPNVSSRTSIINNMVSHSRSWRFVLVPERTGRLIIGQALIRAFGETYRTTEFAVKVHDGNAPVGESNVPPEIFLRAEVDNHHPFQGEQVIYRLEVYFRVNVQNYTPEEFQRTAGFIVEEFPLPRQPEIWQEMVDGTQYNVALIHKLALFPTQTGKLEIPSSATSFEVVKRRRTPRQRDIFDQFFSGGFMENYTEQKRLTTRSITLQVKPLPEPAPADFSGMVGRFALRTSIDRTELETNQPLSFTATLTGRGNIKLIPEFELQLPHDIEAYPPEVESDINRREHISGFKRFTYLLVPRHPGAQSVKPLHFSYFDPDEERYITLESDLIELQVSRSDDYHPGGSILRSGEPIQTYGVDIEYIHVDPGKLIRAGHCFATSRLFYLLLLFPWLIPVTFWGVRRYRDSLRQNQDMRRYRRARSSAQPILNQSRQALKQGRLTDFHTLINQALVGYLADKRGIAAAGLLWEEEIERLRQHGITEGLLTELIELRRVCDLARFAASEETTDGGETVERTQALLNQLERQL